MTHFKGTTDVTGEDRSYARDRGEYVISGTGFLKYLIEKFFEDEESVAGLKTDVLLVSYAFESCGVDDIDIDNYDKKVVWVKTGVQEVTLPYPEWYKEYSEQVGYKVETIYEVMKLIDYVRGKYHDYDRR